MEINLSSFNDIRTYFFVPLKLMNFSQYPHPQIYFRTLFVGLIQTNHIHLFLSSFEFHITAISSPTNTNIHTPILSCWTILFFWSLFFKRNFFFFYFLCGDGWIFNLSMYGEMLTIFKMNESKKTFHSHYHQRRTMVRDV